MQNMETLKLRATPVVAPSTARQGSELSMEKAEKANASANPLDMPTSARSLFAREAVEPSLRRKSK